MNEMTVELHSDGWHELHTPDWGSHTIKAFCQYIDGQPRVIGLQLLPLENDGAAGDWILTAERLRKLKLKDIALTCIGKDFDAVMQAMDSLRNSEAEPSFSEQRHATVEEVAAIYKAAQAAGKAPRKEITERLHISGRTLDRRIADARATGLLEPYKSDAPKPKSGTKKTSSTRRKNG